MTDPGDEWRETIRASLHRTIRTLTNVIADNRKLEQIPGHEESAQRRIRDGEQELARAKDELARLDRGEWPIREE